MSRTRLILLGLLAVLAASVVASALATEPPAKCGGKVLTTPDYCVGGVELENSKGEPISEKVEGTNGEALMKATIGGVASEIKCTKGKTQGSIEDGAAGTVGKSTKMFIKFETCKLLKPTNCKLTAAEETAIETTELKGALALTAGRVEDKLEPREGAFATISIEGINNSCVIAEPEIPKSFNVTGSQLCEIDKSNAEAETETEKHVIICKLAGSSLKIGTNPVQVTNEATVVLSGAKAHAAWSIKED